MAQVYISSTYRDLRDEREAVRFAISSLGHQPVQMEHYGADKRTVLERCTRDVSSSALYVLIVAWRYGWRLAEHGGKSITELEWEAAKSAGVTRYVYIRDDRTEPPPDPATAEDRELARRFRARLRDPSEPMAGRFDTAAQLKERVLADIGPLLGRASGLPTDARVTCDRQDHVATVNKHWIEAARAVPPRTGPIVALVHGTREQGQYLFAERVARCEVPRLPRRASGSPAVPEPVRLDWCDASKPAPFIETMQVQLWGALSSDGAQALWSADDFVSARVPVVVAVEIPLEPWRTKPKLVEAYVESWFAPPFDRLESPTVVLLYARSSEKNVASSLRKIAARFTGEGRSVFDLELDDVQEHEALAWTRSPKVQQFCRDLPEHVQTVFRRKAKWEMEPLMKELEDIACRISVAGGRR